MPITVPAAAAATGVTIFIVTLATVAAQAANFAAVNVGWVLFVFMIRFRFGGLRD